MRFLYLFVSNKEREESVFIPYISLQNRIVSFFNCYIIFKKLPVKDIVTEFFIISHPFITTAYTNTL